MPIVASRVRNIVSWLWLVVCYTATVVGVWLWSAAFVDSDAASELLLARTLLDNGGVPMTTSWLYSTELRIVNTQLVFEPALALFPGNWHAARTLAVAVFLLLILAATWFLFASLGVWNRRTRWVAGALLLPFSALYREFYLMLSYYVPHICMTFLAFGLFARVTADDVSGDATRRPCRIALVAGLAVAFCAGLNGARLILSCYVPLAGAACVTSAIRCRRHGTNWLGEKSWRRAFELLAAAGAGYLANNFVLTRFFTFFDTGAMDIEFDPNPLTPITYLIRTLRQTWGWQPYASYSPLGVVRGPVSILLHIAILAAVLYCVVLWLRGRLTVGQGVLAGALVIGLVINSVAFWLVGRLAERYLSLVAILGLPLFAIATECLAARASNDVPLLDRLGKAARFVPALPGILVALFAVCVAVQAGDDFATQSERGSSPNKHQQIAAWMLDEGYNSVLATFWNANVLTEHSNGAIEAWAYPYGTFEATWFLPPAPDPWLQVAAHVDSPPAGAFAFIVTDEELAEPGLAYFMRHTTQPPALRTDDLSVYTFASYNEYLQAIGVL